MQDTVEIVHRTERKFAAEGAPEPGWHAVKVWAGRQPTRFEVAD